MKVILKQDVKGHGRAGELVEAADGYARNYLLPRGLAVEASPANLSEMKSRENALKHRIESEVAAAKADAAALKDKSVTIAAKTGSGGKLFGSITSKEIAEALAASHGITVEKQKILLPEPIRALGEHEVKIKLGHDTAASVKVVVTQQDK